MEEFFQFVFEAIFQIFVELLADGIWRHLPAPARTFVKGLACVLFAVVLAAISSKLAPAPFLKSESLRIAYLIVVPLLVGAAMAWVGRVISSRGKATATLEKFGFGWLFAFSFACTRYLLAR
jgi:hypothetical protein